MSTSSLLPGFIDPCGAAATWRLSRGQPTYTKQSISNSFSITADKAKYFGDNFHLFSESSVSGVRGHPDNQQGDIYTQSYHQLNPNINNPLNTLDEQMNYEPNYNILAGSGSMSMNGDFIYKGGNVYQFAKSAQQLREDEVGMYNQDPESLQNTLSIQGIVASHPDIKNKMLAIREEKTMNAVNHDRLKATFYGSFRTLENSNKDTIEDIENYNRGHPKNPIRYGKDVKFIGPDNNYPDRVTPGINVRDSESLTQMELQQAPEQLREIIARDQRVRRRNVLIRRKRRRVHRIGRGIVDNDDDGNDGGDGDFGGDDSDSGDGGREGGGGGHVIEDIPFQDQSTLMAPRQPEINETEHTMNQDDSIQNSRNEEAINRLNVDIQNNQYVQDQAQEDLDTSIALDTEMNQTLQDLTENEGYPGLNKTFIRALKHQYGLKSDYWDEFEKELKNINGNVVGGRISKEDALKKIIRWIKSRSYLKKYSTQTYAPGASKSSEKEIKELMTAMDQAINTKVPLTVQSIQLPAHASNKENITSTTATTTTTATAATTITDRKPTLNLLNLSSNKTILKPVNTNVTTFGGIEAATDVNTIKNSATQNAGQVDKFTPAVKVKDKFLSMVEEIKKGVTNYDAEMIHNATRSKKNQLRRKFIIAAEKAGAFSDVPEKDKTLFNLAVDTVFGLHDLKGKY